MEVDIQVVIICRKTTLLTKFVIVDLRGVLPTIYHTAETAWGWLPLCFAVLLCSSALQFLLCKYSIIVMLEYIMIMEDYIAVLLG